MFIFQVQIYSSSTHQVIKSFSRFKDGVFSGSFRHDGKLIIAGEANGHVQVLVFSNLILTNNKSFSSHVILLVLDNTYRAE